MTDHDAANANASDPTMDAITQAVTQGRAGEVEAARAALLAVWADLGVTGDAFHRCVLAHYLADLYDDAAQALTWDVRALDAAQAAGDRVAGFHPSLHLNLADAYRRLGSFEAARAHVSTSRALVDSLADDAYGTQMRAWVEQVAGLVDERDVGRITAS